MFERNWQKRGWGEKTGSQSTTSGFVSKQTLTPAQVIQLVKNGKLRFADNPSNLNIAYHTIMMPDEYMEDLFKIVIDKAAAEAMVSDDEFLENYPPVGSIVLTPADIFCGLMPTGDPIVFTDTRLFCNIGGFGRTGASKTCWDYMVIRQLVKRGFTVVVFQRKNEYDDWATDPELEGLVLPLRYSDFKIALGQAAQGVNQKHHKHILYDNMARSYQRMYAQRLAEEIDNNRSRNLPKGMSLPFPLLIEAVEKFRPGTGYVEARYKESMLYTLKDIEHCFGDIFNCYQSNFLDRLFEWKGLISITIDVPVAASTFFITHIINYEYERRKNSAENIESFRPLAIGLEDGSTLTDEKELGGMSPLVPMTFMSRMYKMGFIYLGHTISHSVSQKLISNLESIFLFGISGEDPRRIQTLLGCTAEQTRIAQLLRPGEFIAMIPSFWPKPIYGRFPYITPPRKLTESERQDIVGLFLDKVEAVKYIAQALPAVTVISVDSGKTQKNYRLSPIELQSLVIAGTGKRLIKTQLYEQLRSNRRDGKKVYDNLEKKGLVRTRTFGRTAFVEVLELGWKILEAKGFKRKESRVFGGFDHTVGVDLIEESEKRKGNSVTFELDLFNNRLDIDSLNRSTGQHTFFNIGVTDPVREATNIIKILKLPVVQSNKFVFVARDAKFVKQVENILKTKKNDKDLLKRLEIKVIADFIKT